MREFQSTRSERDVRPGTVPFERNSMQGWLETVQESLAILRQARRN